MVPVSRPRPACLGLEISSMRDLLQGSASVLFIQPQPQNRDNSADKEISLEIFQNSTGKYWKLVINNSCSITWQVVIMCMCLLFSQTKRGLYSIMHMLNQLLNIYITTDIVIFTNTLFLLSVVRLFAKTAPDFSSVPSAGSLFPQSSQPGGDYKFKNIKVWGWITSFPKFSPALEPLTASSSSWQKGFPVSKCFNLDTLFSSFHRIKPSNSVVVVGGGAGEHLSQAASVVTWHTWEEGTSAEGLPSLGKPVGNSVALSWVIIDIEGLSSAFPGMWAWATECEPGANQLLPWTLPPGSFLSFCPGPHTDGL